MSDRATKSRRCSKCGVAVEACAFCDKPDCPAVICHRCINTTFLERTRPQTTAASPQRN